MKYASSIRFGGQLVDAIDCDYDDYKRLGLLCPECKDPVFLRAEGTRQQNGKEVKINAHFCHFASKNAEQAKACENRVSGYTQADIDRAIAKARGQRLKLLQRWFWEIATRHPNFEDFEVVKLTFCESYGAEIDSCFEVWLKSFRDTSNHEYLKSLIPDKLESAQHQEYKEKPLDPSPMTSIVREFQSKVLSIADLKYQVNVAAEAMDFLKAKSQRDLVYNFFIMAIGTVFINSVDWVGQKVSPVDLRSHKTLTDIAHVITFVISSIPWADEFERIQSQSKAA